MQLWLAIMFAIDSDYDSIDNVMGPLLIFIILCAVAWFVYRRWWRLGRLAARWPLTEATIQSEYACNPTSPGMGQFMAGAAGRVIASNLWNAILQYSYQVEGESYPGYLIWGGPYNSREEASAAARPWLLRKIPVRYNPARPYESSFLRKDGASPGLRSLGDKPPASDDVISLSLK